MKFLNSTQTVASMFHHLNDRISFPYHLTMTPSLIIFHLIFTQPLRAMTSEIFEWFNLSVTNNKTLSNVNI